MAPNYISLLAMMNGAMKPRSDLIAESKHPYRVAGLLQGCFAAQHDKSSPQARAILRMRP